MIQRTSFFFAALILFFSSVLYAVEEPFVTLDSLKGKAEIQRAGRQKWELVAKNTKLYNNDILRVLDKSLAKLKWQNGSIIFVNESSQILINLHRDTINDKLTNYATVFFGAVYFIVKKTLPKEVFTQRDTKVYTPTAILAIRGTSFIVEVDKKNGDTKVAIINGTVLVKNILKSQSLFLSAGYQTEISINTDPLIPSPLLEKEIQALQTWVPPKIVLEEMNKQIIEARRAYTTITGKLEDKILVMPFVNTSIYKGTWKIDTKIAALLAKRMTVTSRLKCHLVPAAKAEVDPIKLGQEEKARFVIAGEIKKFEIYKRAEITAAADKYKEHSIANICIQIQLIDIESQKLIYKNDVCQEVSGKNIEGNSWKYIGKLPLDLKNQAFASSILGKALNQTLEQSSVYISRYLDIK